MRATRLGIFLILLETFFWATSATKICHQCSGINCQRTSYVKTEQCVNNMDVCVTIFDKSIVQAQGCLQQLPENLRRRCVDANGKMMKPDAETQCQMCLSNLCNNEGPKEYECLQCDSEKEERCRSNPAALMPVKCPISRANNMYCYVSDDGKRTMRGCSGLVQEQKDCLSRSNCLLCSPMDFKRCNDVQITNDNSGGGNDGGNGGNDGGNGGNDGGNGGNDGGNGGNDGGNGGNDGGNGGNDGGNGGNDGGNGGGNDGGVVSQSSTRAFNFITLVICLVPLVTFGAHRA